MASIGSKVVVAAAQAARNFGKALDSMGASMEVAKYTERLVPSTRIVSANNVAPSISESATFIAPSANLVGDVALGANSSVWYGATVRGDGNKVTIGSKSNIGDRAVVHIAKIQGDYPTSIGDNVTVKPGAIIHAATLKDFSVVGEGAQVLDGSIVGSNSIIQAGAVVSPKTTVPDGEVWGGAPAKMVRKVTKEDIESIVSLSEETSELAALHAEECSKTYEQVMQDEEDLADSLARGEDYWKKDQTQEEDVLGQGAPGRIFDNSLTNPEEGLKAKE